MPKRTINTRRNKAAATEIAATETIVAPAKRFIDASDFIANPAPASEPAPVVSEPATVDTVEPAPASEPATVEPATPDAVPVSVANVAKSERQAEFNERKAAAILSVLPLYDGQSLSVHRSDKIPAPAAYLERVASPVQKAKSATARDDSALLSYYDHITTYHGGDYSIGFNPDRFGADLGALSRNASLNRVALTECGQHIILTPLGISQARNLVAKRGKR